jgi:hypothetical protein
MLGKVPFDPKADFRAEKLTFQLKKYLFGAYTFCPDSASGLTQKLFHHERGTKSKYFATDESVKYNLCMLHCTY